MHEDPVINRAILKNITIPAGIDEVWEAWTTKQGIQSFFAPDCHVELKLFGKYEILFNPEERPGRRGAEGNIILAVDPNRMLSFTWDAPPHLPQVRKQRTHVVLKFKEMGEKETRIFLCHTGWGDGDEWNRAFDYFDDAWDIIFQRLILRFEKGPIDWSKKDYPTKQEPK